MIEFQGWPKTPRLFRDMIVTEKIDGTNSAVIIEPVENRMDLDPEFPHTGRSFSFGQSAHQDYLAAVAEVAGEAYFVGAQSRKRLITPGKTTDNHGFAQWVFENATHLVEILGPGRHFGEWWGSGIQRGYGLQNGEKRFSLFNVNRYGDLHVPVLNLRTVPVLASGPFDLDDVRYILDDLRETGSAAAFGFMNPEGVVVFHAAGGQVFKATLDNDELPKEMVA